MNQPIDGEVLYEVEVPEEDKARDSDDIADAFRVVARSRAFAGIVIYSKCRHQWIPNCSARWLVKHLLSEVAANPAPLKLAMVEFGKADRALNDPRHGDREIDWHTVKYNALVKLCRELAEKEGESDGES